MPDIHIRPMSEQDLKAVMEIERLCFTLPWSENSYRYDLTQNPQARLWVAEVEGEDGQVHVAGDIVVWLVVDEVQIGTIATHPDFRRRGIARALLFHALEDARQLRIKQAFLEVRSSNLGAQALYTQLGFKQIGVRRRYYQDNGEDALLMSLDL